VKPTDSSAPAKILVVEDERDIAALISYHLTKEGYRVRTAESGDEAIRSVKAERPDLIVLDVMLPGLSGHDVLTRLRDREDEQHHVPIIVLTARREEADRVKGFELGADDYLTKPFSPRELVLRVAAILRRAHAPAIAQPGRLLSAGTIEVAVDANSVKVSGRVVELTPTEYRLLVCLIEKTGRVQTREQLLRAAWDVHADIETRTVDMHVQRLRSKLGPAGDQIETVRGFGYRITSNEPTN
jgi:two-component system, OmpR family, phosphate regulon response regulator PhoB